MASEMEQILGLGPIGGSRSVPGTQPVEGREFIYVSCAADCDFSSTFDTLVRAVEHPIPKSGGAVSENCKLTLPSGETFFALSYKGDLSGWRDQIRQGADMLQMKVASIEAANLVIEGGDDVPISECKVEYF